MHIQIKLGDLSSLSSCREALLDSELGKIYGTYEGVTASLTAGLNNEEVFVAIDTDNGICVGYIWIDLNGAFSAFPYVKSIAVSRKYRSQGVGKKMIAYFEQVGFAKNQKICLLVSDFNYRAKKLYMELGYEEVTLIPNLFKTGIGEYLMVKIQNNRGIS